MQFKYYYTSEMLPDGKKIKRYCATFGFHDLKFVQMFNTYVYTMSLQGWDFKADLLTDIQACVTNRISKSFTSLDLMNGFSENSNIKEINTVVSDGTLILIPTYKDGITPVKEDLAFEGCEFVLNVSHTVA